MTENLQWAKLSLRSSKEPLLYETIGACMGRIAAST